MNHRTLSYFFVFVALVLPDSFILAKNTTQFFSDDFNRPDSVMVGNGWSAVQQLPGRLSILNGALVDADQAGMVAAVYHPVSFKGSLSISADLSEESGGGGLPNRYQTVLAIKDDGSGRGYGIKFDRGDANYPSFIELIDKGVVVGVLQSSFQFGAKIHTSITFEKDGSVSGTVTQQGDSYTFSFPARKVLSTGNNFSIQMGEYFAGAPNSIMPTVDNLVLSAPELSSCTRPRARSTHVMLGVEPHSDFKDSCILKSKKIEFSREDEMDSVDGE
jgi:hypothetical protein